MRGFRDRDFVQTWEDMFFCVIGNAHPKDRVITYLKYVPSRLGRWGGGEQRYARILKSYTTISVEEVLNFLKARYPYYVSKLENLGLEMITVPVDRIKIHFKPEDKLRQLSMTKPDKLDRLERAALELTKLLSETAGVDMRYLGVTGSILLGIHNPGFSDIDLVVYGRNNSFRVETTLEALHEEGVIQRITGERFRKWVVDKARQYNLSLKDAEEICRRTWNRGFYKDTPFSIHPVRIEEEVEVRYDDIRCLSEGSAKVRAVVVDDEDSLFLPAVYKVSEVEFLDGNPVQDLVEIVTYEGFYSGILKKGEWLEARGKVEKVVDRRNMKTYHRLLIGSFEAKARDYVKPLSVEKG
ncbi:hypothetical protein DRO57_00935 [Candidatus Bathyarchaeota archaeon]|nr:MAG: hypothetical protein DRO57_00935 [Candidatus Bathyarchaeota archaeon]